MSIHNKKTARLLQGVALGLIIISATLFLGCENPVGGAENNPLADFAGKTYKSEHRELFSVTTNTVKLGFGDSYNTEGKIVESRTTPEGTVYLLECSNHSNFIPSQYPDYEDKANIPHKDCYTLLYIQSITSKNVTWAQFQTVTGEEPELTDEQKAQGLKAVTACFSNKADAEEYLDLNKWTSVWTSEATAQN